MTAPKHSYTMGKDGPYWALVGPDGGIHIWARPVSPDRQSFREERFIGGVEVHYRKQPSWADAEPHHEDCWLIGGPCWHDGTSLYFSERIEPMLDAEGDGFTERSHEYVRSELEYWYRTHFVGVSE